MHWELWDTGSANLVEEFDTEAEALQGVREILAVNRTGYIDVLALGAMYDEGDPRDAELPPVLAGADLQSRLAEIAQTEVTAAARSVHNRIRRWLAEEGWAFEEVPDPKTHFNFRVSLLG